MPKFGNRRDSSSRRIRPSSNQDITQGSKAVNKVPHGNDENGEHLIPSTVLASNQEAIQRLADIAQYIKSSFSRDMDVVEDNCIQMDREAEIQKLKTTLETLSLSKSNEMEKLRCENEQLKSDQEACQLERERYRTLQQDLDTQYKEQHRQTVEEEKERSRQEIKNQKAIIHADYKRNIQELQRQNKDLNGRNEDLTTKLSKAEEKLEIKKKRHGRERETLEKTVENLTLELRQVKTEFPVQMHTTQE